MTPEPSPYEELLHLPHHVSRVHPQMTLLNRAAQFAPFAALVGFGDKVHEQGRLTTARRDLDEQARSDLDYRLAYLLEIRHQLPEVTIEYFVPDAQKEGGEYRYISGIVEGILHEERHLLLRDHTRIPLDDIVSITGDPFLSWDASES